MPSAANSLSKVNTTDIYRLDYNLDKQVEFLEKSHKSLEECNLLKGGCKISATL